MNEDFEIWWKKMKPAECDELKEVFRECWEVAWILSSIKELPK